VRYLDGEVLLDGLHVHVIVLLHVRVHEVPAALHMATVGPPPNLVTFPFPSPGLYLGTPLCSCEADEMRL
jgi:hypothetical protein